MIIPVVFFMLQSHTIGEGPVFSKHAFNANGMSPLVAQFKRMHHLSPQAGQSVLLSRTEIDSFPPLDKQTYDDFLRKSFQKMHERQHNCRRWTIKKKSRVEWHVWNVFSYCRRWHKEDKRQREFVLEQRAMVNEIIRQEKSLLSQKREVKRLADLIMLEINVSSNLP